MNENKLTVDKAARYLKVSRQAIYIALVKKLIKGEKHSNYWLLTKKDLDDYQKNRWSRTNKQYDGEPVYDSQNLSVAQASSLLKQPLNFVYSRIRNGKIKAYRKGCSWIVPRSELSKFTQLKKELIA